MLSAHDTACRHKEEAKEKSPPTSSDGNERSPSLAVATCVAADGCAARVVIIVRRGGGSSGRKEALRALAVAAAELRGRGRGRRRRAAGPTSFSRTAAVHHWTGNEMGIIRPRCAGQLPIVVPHLLFSPSVRGEAETRIMGVLVSTGRVLTSPSFDIRGLKMSGRAGVTQVDIMIPILGDRVRNRARHIFPGSGGKLRGRGRRRRGPSGNDHGRAVHHFRHGGHSTNWGARQKVYIRWRRSESRMCSAEGVFHGECSE